MIRKSRNWRKTLAPGKRWLACEPSATRGNWPNALGNERTIHQFAEQPQVAFGNHRIKEVKCHEDGTGEVTFTYQPSGERRYRKMTVTAEDFIRRFLQHVLPTGFQKVRHFGFIHKRSKFKLDWLSMLVTVTLNMHYVLIIAPPVIPAKRVAKCSERGGELVCVSFVPWSASSLPAPDSS